MLFDFEPSGVNDTYLRLIRNGVSCILVPADSWNGLIRVNYLAAGASMTADPQMVFRCLDVGWDDGRFFWKGKAHPVSASSSMAAVLTERGLIAEGEADSLLFGVVRQPRGHDRDDTLLLRAVLSGTDIAPVYDDAPLRAKAERTMVGFAIRTLSDPTTYLVGQRDGLPVLTAEARDALLRQLG